MKILVGLGNPGKEHVRNRHNLGFLLVDAWARAHHTEFNKEEFRASIARTKVGAEDVLVMKPLTYMNRSGEAIASAMQFYKIPIENLVVLHDELDLPPMGFRIKLGGGAGGNNGIKSIVSLGENFTRIRLGIGRPPHPDHDIADYVLGNLNQAEWDYWDKNIVTVTEAIDMCLSGQVDVAMNKYNRRT